MSNFTKIKKELEGKAFKEQMMVVKKYVVFDSPCNIGIYQIEDFYIGKSNNILGRITHHVLELIDAYTNNIVFNKKKLYLIKSILEKGKLSVKLLDKSLKKEKYYIEKLYYDLPLTNIEFVTDYMVSKKHRIIKSKIRNKKFEIEFEKFTTKYFVAKTFINGVLLVELSKTQKGAKKLLLDYINKPSTKKSRKLKKLA